MAGKKKKTVRFKYDGILYEVSDSVLDDDYGYIQLPDGRVLQVGNIAGSSPILIVDEFSPYHAVEVKEGKR